MFDNNSPSAAIRPGNRKKDDGSFRGLAMCEYVDQTGLYLRATDSGETHAVSLPPELRGRVWEVCWFPEGGKLLADVSSAEGMDLWVITILGEAAPRMLYRHAIFPAISPDRPSRANSFDNVRRNNLRD